MALVRHGNVGDWKLGDERFLETFHLPKRDDGGPAEPLGYASYRYDGLEAEGRLRFCGYRLQMTSDPRHVSVVLYRKVEASASDEAEAVVVGAAAAGCGVCCSASASSRAAAVCAPPAKVGKRKRQHRNRVG